MAVTHQAVAVVHSEADPVPQAVHLEAAVDQAEVLQEAIAVQVPDTAVAAVATATDLAEATDEADLITEVPADITEVRVDIIEAAVTTEAEVLL